MHRRQLAERQEGADAVDIREQAAFVCLLRCKLHRAVFLNHVAEFVPGFLLAGHAEAQDDHAFVVFFFEDQAGHRVASF